MVIGHAVLHHIPDVELAFREILRVLKPGGRFVFAGEPTRHGDVVARRLSRFTWWAATRATRLPRLAEWRRPQQELDESSRAAALEAVVDMHTFVPAELAALARARRRRRRAGRDLRAARVLVRLAGAHVRVRGAQGEARDALGQLRAARLAGDCPPSTRGWRGSSRPGCSTTPRSPAESPDVSVRRDVVLFDLDGTVSDSATGILAALRHGAAPRELLSVLGLDGVGAAAS